MLANKKITVVLPAYNAAQTLKQTFNEIPHDIVDDIILADDASKDDTVAMARSLGIKSVTIATGGSQQPEDLLRGGARPRSRCRCDAASRLPVHAETGNRDGLDDLIGGIRRSAGLAYSRP